MRRKPGKITRRRARSLDLKVRVKPLVRMPVSVMVEKVKEASQFGVVPDDIEIMVVDYTHKVGRRIRAATRFVGDRKIKEALKDFSYILLSGKAEIRVEAL